jgi:hypothetical protein
MAIKKSDLYSSLWASCNELRGGMDASQYKDYVLRAAEALQDDALNQWARWYRTLNLL